MRQKRKNKIIIFSLLGLLCIMAVGYAAFNTNLKIKGTSGISSNWDIKITNVTKANEVGGAEEVKAPTWTDLTAYMEANLYEKGDAIEYDVTVENRGTIDATLDNVTENIKSTNEAVKITFSGYTKGEKLFKNSSQIIKVKIEYNPEFEGTPEEGSGEVSVDLNYTQAEGGTITPTDKYLVTYDCVTNGGQDCSSYNEYLNEEDNVNLSYKGEKKGSIFKGWSLDKNSVELLNELKMPSENVTLYAIFESTKPIIRSWSSTDATDFHSPLYKSNIITAKFLNNKDIPENATDSWDVSEAGDKSVMAWVVPDTNDKTKYHLYIGGNGGVIANENSGYLFYYFTGLTSIDFNGNYDTSNAKTMNSMFANSRNSDTQVYETSLVEIKGLENFNTSNVKDMNSMFMNQAKLKSLNLSNFDTSKVTNMGRMFQNMLVINTLDLRSFNTSSVTNMELMFCGDLALEKIKGLTNFDTGNVTTMKQMFWRCTNITVLNLCSFDTKNVTDMYATLGGCSILEKVYVGSKWTTDNIDTTNLWYQSNISAVTKSDNCMIDAEESAILSFSTSKTTKSITVIATASAESGIEKYEYSKDGGKTWIESSDSIYTFTGLTQNTQYPIKVRVTSKIGKVTTADEMKVTTDDFSAATYALSPAGELYGQTKTVTVTAQCEACKNEYSIDGGKTWEDFPSNEFKIKYLSNNNLITRTSDGDNTVSSSCTITNIDSTEPGVIKINPGSKILGGYLECNGQAVSRTTYAELFKVIGTTYGSGNGSTTFNLPNLNERTVIGTSSSHAFASTGGAKTHYHATKGHALTVAEMPNHAHNIAFYKTTPWETDNVRPEESNAALYGGYSNSKKGTRYAYSVSDTSSSAGGYVGGNAAHNHGNTESASSMQPYIAMKYVIRY